MALPAIPDELLAEIFLCLPVQDDVISASRVCVSFRRIVANHSFLRRFRKPLLGFLSQQRSDKHIDFYPTFVSYPSTPEGNATTFVADFSFSFLPAGDWAVRDIRDGRVLLDSAHDNSCDGSFFTETVVCYPLHRRYLLLPPIPSDLVALLGDAVLIKQRSIYETFLLPPSDDTDEEDTSFKVIWISMSMCKLVVFVFSSSTGQWLAGPSRRWKDLFPDVPLLWSGDGVFCRRQYANGCFYWLIKRREKLLVLDTRMMEFYCADAPPGTKNLRSRDMVILEEGENTTGMFVRASDTYYLKYTIRGNSDWRHNQWDMVKIMSLDSTYFFIGSMGRCVLLFKTGLTGTSLDEGCFSLDIKTFQLERVCASKPGISNTHLYSNFLPSLFSTPTI